MRSIQDVLKKSQTFQKILVSETCDKHYYEGRQKKVQMVQHNGEVFCPVCERNEAAEALGKAETERQKRVDKSSAYKTLATKSILADETLRYAEFSNYLVDREPEVALNKQKTTELCVKLIDGEQFNLWLHGPPGVGKSHLAMSTLKAINEYGDRNKSCLFISVDKMLFLVKDRISNKESPYSEAYFVEMCSDVDFLVLDDLGAETGAINTNKPATDYTLRLLNAIANGRQGKSTIITTNLPTSTLKKMYDGKLVSRLLRNYKLIKFSAATSDKRVGDLDF